MRHHPLKLRAVAVAIAVSFGFGATRPESANASGWTAQQYCNEKYMYCVGLPSSGKAEPHEGDAPNHGITVALPQAGNEVWTYAHWDAALLEGSQKAALGQLEIIFGKHHDADVSIARAALAGLSAYRIRFTYTDSRPMAEEFIIAYRKPKDASKDTGIIYEIGLKCSQSSYGINASIFETFVRTFRQTE